MGNLVAAHDAATAHRGSPWRMPTADEIDVLVSNCATTWITTNGVSGRLFTGKGDYANRCIFLPAAGCGLDSGLGGPDSYYWSSTPISDIMCGQIPAWSLGINWVDFCCCDGGRDGGRSVRPVRGFAP